MGIAEIVEKRKRIWAERHDIEYDKQFVRASARKILTTSALAEEVIKKPYLLIEVAFYIVDKERNTVPFFLNDVQRDFICQLETLGTNKPFYVLKGRQQGFTSVITAIQLSYAIVRKNFSGFTMADRTDNTMAIFNDKARVVYDRLPEELKPSEKFNSRNEMFFDKLNSSWRIATATDQVGRSRTLNFVHFSEVAFYECDLSSLQAGIGEATTAGAIVIYETTANGFNQAKTLWDSGSCHNLFYEWWRTSEYRSQEYEYLDTSDSWLKERLNVLGQMGCDKEQLTWYAKKYASYVDKTLIRQEYPITPEEAFITTGTSVFDSESVNEQIVRYRGLQVAKRGWFKYKRKPRIVGDGYQTVESGWELTDIVFEESETGYITIHSEPRVERDRDGILRKCPYVIGADPAGLGIDYFAAKVIDNTNGKTVATLHKQRMDMDLFSEQLYCIGRYYNDALIAPETNISQVPVRVLRDLGYTNIYMRERVDTMSREVVKAYGFETTRKTKPVIVEGLVQVMRENPDLECDVNTLKELLTFTRREDGTYGAIEGAHDDLVIALAIAHFCGEGYSHLFIESKEEREDVLAKYFKFEDRNSGNGGYMQWD